MDEAPDTESLVAGARIVLIREISASLDIILWRRAGNNGSRRAHRIARQRDLQRLLPKLDSFQEEPQLLDVHLSHWTQQLSQAYVATLSQDNVQIVGGYVKLQVAISKILYTLCKVRGEKIIVGLLNNEPKYLQPLVRCLEKINADSRAQELGSSWEEQYVLLLWISHLLLAPFDLASISKANTAEDTDGSIIVPAGLPSLVYVLVPIAYQSLAAASIEQKAAATLLVRLCLRPDMRKAGLLDSLSAQILSRLDRPTDPIFLHELLGHLSFCSKLVASGSQHELDGALSDTLVVCQRLLTDDSWSSLRTSAVARKLLLKLLRDLTITAVQSDVYGIDTSELLESTIGHLLQMLADSDTPVRMAASKALSQITVHVEPELRDDILNAILDLLKQDVLKTGEQQSLSAVNALHWHGLTLTLSHLLYQRALQPGSLVGVLDALLLALTFEQRSSTGNAVGTNVRDAANFGLWAVARRYTSSELKKVIVTDISSLGEHTSHRTAIQLVATHLISSACLDPAGNVRRGSSAALQELIGRHPDEVICGISLVQIVDYHAVGLRATAMARAAQAAALSDLYWSSLLGDLRGWRGLLTPDADSRILAAESVAQLGSVKSPSRIIAMVHDLCSIVKQSPSSDIIERHGLVLAIAFLLRNGTRLCTSTSSTFLESDVSSLRDTALSIVKEPQMLLISDPSAYQSSMKKPELTAYAALSIVEAVCTAIRELAGNTSHSIDVFGSRQILSYCFRRTEQSVLGLIPAAVNALACVDENLKVTVEGWLSQIRGINSASPVTPAVVLALGSVYSVLPDEESLKTNIPASLVTRAMEAASVEQRVLALQGLKLILRSKHNARSVPTHVCRVILPAIINGLNDVTITERGDVGSHARLEALAMTIDCWPTLIGSTQGDDFDILCSTVTRLSLERLDKVRVAARESLRVAAVSVGNRTTIPEDDFAFCSYVLVVLDSTNDMVLKEAIVEGYCSSAGLGSEAFMQIARCALSQWLSSEQTELRLSVFVGSWTSILQRNLFNDRVAQPMLDTMAFISDYGHIQSIAIQQSSVKLVPLQNIS